MDVSSEQLPMTAGLDLGDRYSYPCVSSTRRAVIEEGRLPTNREALRRRFASERPLRVAIEAGTHSPWVSRVLEECGHEVLVANPRRTRLIYASKRKTDKVDAQSLARLARVDPKLLYPLKHRGEDSQAHPAIIRSREALVACRTQLINHVPKERSSPSGPACPSALPEASTRGRPSTSPRHSCRPLGPSWSRVRLADAAHPPIRSPAGDGFRRILSGNGALEAGRRDRAAYGAHVRAHPRGSPPLRERPQRRSLSWAGTC
jgi:Transposase